MFKSKKLIPKEEHDLRVEIGKYEIYLSEAKNKLKGKPSPFYMPMFSCPADTIEMIRTWRDIQGTQGCWDADDYMLGMFNGIEMCLAALENREPDFRTREDQPFAFDEEGNLPNLEPVFDTYAPTTKDAVLSEMNTYAFSYPEYDPNKETIYEYQDKCDRLREAFLNSLPGHQEE